MPALSTHVRLLQYELPHYRKPFFAALGSALAPQSEFILSVVPKWSLGLGLKLLMELGLRSKAASDDVVVLNYEASNAVSWLLLAGRKLGLYRARTVLWGCGYEPPHKGAKKKLRILLYRAMGNSADQIICYSQVALQHFKEIGVRTPMEVAPNSIDDEEIKRAMQSLDEAAIQAVRGRFGIQDSFNVVFIGRLIPAKRLDLSFAAFSSWTARRAIPPGKIKFFVIGGGPALNDAKRSAESAQLVETHFLGEILDKGQIAAIARNCHVFLLTGTGGLAINEAMCYGLPVISSEADGTAGQLIDDGVNGILIRTGLPEDFADALDRLYSDSELRNKMSLAARATIDNKVNLKTMVATFRDVLTQWK